MKHLIQILIVAVVGTLVNGSENEKYTSKYDNFNVDTVINSPRLLKNYVHCVVEKGPCTPEGEELKKNIPDALKTNCSKCSTKQKELTDKILQHLIRNEPNFWKMLQDKYDPYEKYTDEYLKLKNKESV
ncbi:hypothetical protein FQA39_LY10780 [Lamprigera yunnana]|nr:hypothetical protein FQA39_LY10780 [Lamprigera yunnana]